MIFLRSHIATFVVMLLFVIVPYPLYIQSCLIILVIFHSGPYGCYEYGSIRDINVADKDIKLHAVQFFGSHSADAHTTTIHVSALTLRWLFTHISQKGEHLYSVTNSNIMGTEITYY